MAGNTRYRRSSLFLLAAALSGGLVFAACDEDTISGVSQDMTIVRPSQDLLVLPPTITLPTGLEGRINTPLTIQGIVNGAAVGWTLDTDDTDGTNARDAEGSVNEGRCSALVTFNTPGMYRLTLKVYYGTGGMSSVIATTLLKALDKHGDALGGDILGTSREDVYRQAFQNLQGLVATSLPYANWTRSDMMTTVQNDPRYSNPAIISDATRTALAQYESTFGNRTFGGVPVRKTVDDSAGGITIAFNPDEDKGLVVFPIKSPIYRGMRSVVEAVSMSGQDARALRNIIDTLQPM